MFSKGNRETQKSNLKNDSTATSKETSSATKIPKAAGITSIAAGSVAAVCAVSVAYKVSGEQKNYKYGDFVKQSMEDQAYEVLSNSDIDKRIRHKTKEIELLKQKLDELETLEVKKRKRKDLYNLLNAQILNKSHCLDSLKTLNEKKESITQSLNIRNELTTEIENISFLHPIKKRGISNKINELEINAEYALMAYKSLESKVAENEKAEEALAKKYYVMENKAIEGKSSGIFKVAIATIGICLICGFIAFLVG